MKVVHINKSDAGGGASVAALRIHRSLIREGIDSYILVQEKKRAEANEYQAGNGLLYKMANFKNFVVERLAILPSEKEAAMRYYFSIANTGRDLAKLDVVRNADIIHLHWINQGFLSLDGLKDIIALGKPIVWTLHDMWPFTGGCHYAGTCLEFNEHCGYCPFLRSPNKNDLSARTFNLKKEIYSKANLTIVTCSRWLSTLSKSSSLFRSTPVYNVPNPIDTNFYHQLDREMCRKELNLPVDKKLLLFGAANIQDIRKGFRYLEEALTILNDSFPKLSNSIELIVFGKVNNKLLKRLPFKVNSQEFISNPMQLVKLYNAADTFILPSLQDNLPNTAMESLCCGTPVVGFRIGGIPEMVEHGRTGYLAEVKNSLSLADGIYNMLFFGTAEQRQMVRDISIQKFSEHIVAQQYINVYNKALSR